MVLKVLIDKLTEVKVITKINDLLAAVNGTFLTDIKTDQIYALVQMQLDDMASWNIETMSVTGSGAMRTSYAMGNGSTTTTQEVEVSEPVYDEEGNPVLDEEGNQVYETRTETQTITTEAQTYSVMIVNQNSVNEARAKLQEVLSGN